MAEVAMPIKPKVDRVNIIILSGRIQNIQQPESGGFITELVLPAPDEYSKPEIVPVHSKRRLGREGDIIDSLPCRVGGYVRLFNLRDGSKGREHRVRFEPMEE